MPDQFVVQRRIVVEPHQVCGNLNVEVGSQRPSVSEHLCRFSHSLSALLNHRDIEFRRLRVAGRCALKGTPGRRKPTVDPHHERRVHCEPFAVVGLREHRPDLRPISQRHRLVVAHDREVVRQLHQLSLAANGVEDRLPTHAGGGRDGIDGGTGITVFSKELSCRINDPSPRPP